MIDEKKLLKELEKYDMEKSMFYMSCGCTIQNYLDDYGYALKKISSWIEKQPKINEEEYRRIVLKKHNNSFLIAKVRSDNSVREYVVCSDWDGHSWCCGNYFEKLDDALEYFNKDRM